MPLDGGRLMMMAMAMIEGWIQPAVRNLALCAKRRQHTEGFGSPEVGCAVDFGTGRAVCQSHFLGNRKAWRPINELGSAQKIQLPNDECATTFSLAMACVGERPFRGGAFAETGRADPKKQFRSRWIEGSSGPAPDLPGRRRHRRNRDNSGV